MDNKSIVGIDIGKQSSQAVRLRDDGKVDKWFQCTMDLKGIESLIKFLNNDDLIAIEAGSTSFRLARYIESQTKCKVLVLNPNDLVQIYSSLKKTDKEDALKIARIVLRNPIDELPIVHMPTLENEEHRRLLSEHGFWTNSLTKLKNRLHSVFQLNSMIHVSRSNFKIPSRRIILMKELKGTLLAEAQRINNQIILIEQNIKDIENLMKEVLRENIAYTELTMSIPGVGLITAFTFFSYLGDCSRFKSSKSIAFYAGLVPRVDISGKKVHYGGIIKRGCRPIRRIILQSSWALIRSAEGGPLKEFYLKKYTGIGKKKAAVAVARKMITTFYSMMNSGELYRGTTEKSRIRRLKHYGLYVKT